MWFQAIFKGKQRQQHTRPDSGARHIGGESLPVAFTPSTLRQLNRMQLNASRYLHGSLIGNRPSVRRRPSPDFHEHRAYAPGDDTRFVDWKASARQEHIYIRQGIQPKEITVYLLIDCSASMAWGSPSKSSALLQIAAALSYLSLAGGDRLVIDLLSSTGSQILGPFTGKGQFPGILRKLQTVPFQGKCQLRAAVSDLARRNLSKGGLVFLLTDLLDFENLADCLVLLPSPTWDVNILHLLHQNELEPAFSGDYQVEDVETGALHNFDIRPETLAAYQAHLKAWLNRVAVDCVDHHVFYTLIPTNWALDSEILPHLRKTNVLKPV